MSLPRRPDERRTAADGVVRVTLLVLLGYWLLYSLTAPVKATDANVYHLARLYVIRQGGLLHNQVFNPLTWMQIVFPWTFDAAHWPFVRLGFGYSLPSFACFLGIVLVTYRTVRDRFGGRCAELCCLALLALPMLVFQATAIKNDIPVVFGISCWFYSLVRFAEHGRTFHLLANALAIAFTGGVKTSGVPFVPLLGLISAWQLRARPAALGRWLLFLVPSCVLLLSIETYAASHGLYGNALGPTGLRLLRNLDGIAGTAANLIRIVFRNVDLGIDAVLGRKSALTVAMEDLCRRLLGALGLENVGYGLEYRDADLDFSKRGLEAFDDFGPLGMLALLALPVLLLGRAGAPVCRILAGAAVGGLALVAATTGDMPFNNRFLLLPFTLATIALTIRLYPRWAASAAFRGAFLALLLFGAVVLPLCSFNRRPVDVWLALADRDVAALGVYPANIPVVRAVRRRAAACPASRWVVTAHPLAWEFTYYDLLRERAVIARRPQVNPLSLATLHQGAPDGCLYVLGLGQSVSVPNLTELAAFADVIPGQSTRVPRPCPDCDTTRLYLYTPRLPGHPCDCERRAAG